MGRAVRDADAEAEAPARNLVDVGRTGREFLGRLGIDRRDRGAEGDPLGGQSQTRALRHVAVAARHVDAGKAAPLDLAGDLQGLAPPSGHGDEADRGEGLRHRRLRCQWLVGCNSCAGMVHHRQVEAVMPGEFWVEFWGAPPPSASLLCRERNRIGTQNRSHSSPKTFLCQQVMKPLPAPPSAF